MMTHRIIPGRAEEAFPQPTIDQFANLIRSCGLPRPSQNGSERASFAGQKGWPTDFTQHFEEQ